MEKGDKLDKIQKTLDYILLELKIVSSHYSTPSTLSEEELYEQAKKMALKKGRMSTSTLQRKFMIGYARAARLKDYLIENGIIKD